MYTLQTFEEEKYQTLLKLAESDLAEAETALKSASAVDDPITSSALIHYAVICYSLIQPCSSVAVLNGHHSGISFGF